tara:strand:+ start:12010 stop:13524 length:1515 start_codon:yes stop_codon:yes gene_type:complete
MIQLYFIRSTIFNLCFYVLTGICCIILLPTLILPRQYYMAVVYGFVHTTAFLEKYILGLSYEIRGKEHLPPDGSYIVAAKHQSAYETFKLHILFNDPAIVLKKELLKIPLWGKYLGKSDVIAIDRSTPKIAIKSIQDGAKRVMAQNRSIVIFPQGTRVPVDMTAQEKPYKIGLIRIQEATGLPIIPMALNTGIFYPRNKWCKKPGRVIFEFLPPVLADANAKAGDTLKKMEMDVEEKSAHLMDEARQNMKRANPLRFVVGTGIVLCVLYTGYWFTIAHFVKQSITNSLADIRNNSNIIDYQGEPPRLYGFPGKLRLSLPKQTVLTKQQSFIVDSIEAQSWPIPGMPITFSTGNIYTKMGHWRGDLVFDGITGSATHWFDTLNLNDVVLAQKDTQGIIAGSIRFSEPYPVLDLDIAIKNHQPFLMDMVAKKIIKDRPAAIAAVALQAMQQNGVVRSKITSQDNKVYLGPIRIYVFPDVENNNAALLANGQESSFATKRVKPALGR